MLSVPNKYFQIDKYTDLIFSAGELCVVSLIVLYQSDSLYKVFGNIPKFYETIANMYYFPVHGNMKQISNSCVQLVRVIVARSDFN